MYLGLIMILDGKKRTKELLLETNGENLPMKFDEFKPGKFIITLHYNLLI